MSLPRCSLLVVTIIPVILLVPSILFIYLHLSHEPVLSDAHARGIDLELTICFGFAWAMEVCRDDNEERAVVASSMNAMEYAIIAWLPIVVFPQTMAPSFFHDFNIIDWFNNFRLLYPTSFAFNIAAIIGVVGIYLFVQWEKKKNEATAVPTASFEEDLNLKTDEKDYEKNGAIPAVKTVEG
ncbi:hypothetical protein DL95DRAFT_407698 [Leptodontidium sp. 2 PMI_412]|nr:hypothetical protein DL95DRAFT_407698 [Leptodontidium sp. 2 PMI_412]